MNLFFFKIRPEVNPQLSVTSVTKSAANSKKTVEKANLLYRQLNELLVMERLTYSTP
ncbi:MULTISPECIES: hypothetical protein [unclassified Coleofasciculus]|uniref:hypothetical protein n=1 Tax=unclassified Coleofasciculus TaxID=2692782 RepID=UPI00187E4430|nr:MULTISPECIES: hypothetical protein [unclassified Coleofasciculus]MBE9127082.1 hypothetical protein [Coleofasciculus sp. LEGE 07081]MBE9150470.1 hypothetical protein [Coleofasciculus sp. LEGE 07092]